jgi:phosphoglycolate phosphatase-like HAD superfamily hydrolase
VDLVGGVLGRPYARPDLMKPDPFLAVQAIELLDRGRLCMIGDAVTDIEFSRSAGLAPIASAKSPRHETRLRPAGPDAVIRAMTALADCL